MDRQQANEQSRKSGRGSRSLRCIWYCGKINEEIRKAVRLGEKSVKIVFPPQHYVVQHRELFQEIFIRTKNKRETKEPDKYQIVYFGIFWCIFRCGSSQRIE